MTAPQIERATPAIDVAAALATLALALARATPAERAAAAARLDALAKSGRGAPAAEDPGPMQGSIRNALMPARRVAPSRRTPRLAALALVAAASAPGALRLLRAVHARVKAFAA
jgi:hypothetical protein